MNKLILLLIVIAIVTAAVVARKRTPAADVAAPLAALTANASSDIETTLPSRSPSVAQELPTMEDRVGGLSAAIWQELNSTNEDGHEIVFTNLLPELMALDPGAAARLVEASGPEMGREELLRQLIQTWTVKDSAAALTWAEQLTDTNEQRRAWIYATKQMAETDPAAAVTTAARYHLGDEDDAIMADLALVWAGTDLPGALTWAGDQPAGKQRDEVMSRIALVKSRTTPEAAVRLVVEQIPPGSIQQEAAISVLHQWAQQDFAAAKAWAECFPAGSLRERALAELSREGGGTPPGLP